jgi:group I intron endonuclease
MLIYFIKNIVNNKLYIGQTTKRERWSHHRSTLKANKHHNTHLQNSWIQYGETSFIYGILKNDIKSIDELNQYEIKFINEYDTLNSEKGYNIRCGGENGSLSDKHKKSISMATKGRIFSDTHRLNLKLSKVGTSRKPHSEETKTKMSKSATGRFHTKETKQKLSKYNTGKKLSIDAKIKCGLSNKGKFKVIIPLEIQNKIKKEVSDHSIYSLSKKYKLHFNVIKRIINNC